MAKPEPSQWGKINAGQQYGLLCTDIGRAIFAVDWGKYAKPLLFYVIEHSWGVARTKGRAAEWPDPVPCQVNFNALANLWGFPRQRLYEARDWLKEANVLRQTPRGFWIRKDADRWIDPQTGQPLLSPKMLAYALAARTRKGETHEQASVTPGGDNVTPGGDKLMRQVVTPGGDILSHPVVTNGTPPLRTPPKGKRFKTTGGGRAVEGFDEEAAEGAVLLADDLLGEEAAAAIRTLARRISEQTRGRWDRVLVAIRKASQSRKAIDSIVGWVIGTANGLDESELGADAGPVGYAPAATAAPSPDERARKRAEFMAKITGGEHGD
jgi:hypothetical protein